MLPSPLVVIVGPTASGKSALAMEIAKKWNGELICADSRTVYKGMDIGTAKPSKADQRAIRHHLLDIVEPDESFTAADFKQRAQSAIEDIQGRGMLPIVVGGTGLYIDAVIFDYIFGPPADPSWRSALQKLSLEELQQMCRTKGIPIPANNQNKRHLVRAIELGGLKDSPKKLRPNTLVVAITTDRDQLRSRIDLRAEQMVAAGIVEEAAALGARFGWDSEAMTGNIYRILHPVISQEVPLQQALKAFITSDMQLAKRQVTWFKRNPYITWGRPEQLKVAIEHFVQQNNLLRSIPHTS